MSKFSVTMDRGIFFLCLFLLTGVGVFAQTLTLEQARTLALANSRSLARYETSIRTSILDEKNQLYSTLPSVSASYSASMTFLTDDWKFVNPIDTFSTGLSFSITQIIFQGGKSVIQKAINAIATESVRKDALAEYFNVLDSVDSAYYAVLEAAATLEAEESSLESARLGLSIAEIRQQSGMINLGDYLKALADLEARENSRNQARRNLTLSMTKLKNLTGLLEISQLEQIDFSAYDDVLTRLAAITDEDVDALFDRFWNLLAISNPSLAKAALASQRAEQNYNLSNRDYAPTISATVFSGGINYSVAKGFSFPSSASISIRGTIPIDFWVLNNRAETRRIARDSALNDYTNTEMSMLTDLQTALLNMLAQAGSVLSSRRSFEYTEKHFEYVMERYRLLQSSVSDLNEASTLFINSRNSLIRASYSFLQSLSRLRSLCALDDEDRLIRLLLGA